MADKSKKNGHHRAPEAVEVLDAALSGPDTPPGKDSPDRPAEPALPTGHGEPASSGKKAPGGAVRLITRILVWAGIVFYALFTLASLLSSSRLIPNDPEETVHFRWDIFPITLLVFALFLALCLFLHRHTGWRRPGQKALLNALTVWVLAVGVIWVFMMRAYPYADSYWVFTTANQFSAGHYTAVEDAYIRYFPYQLGTIFYLECIARVFGGENFLLVQLINVLWVALLYRTLVHTAALLFKSPRVPWLLTLLLFGCLQPVLYSSLVYGSVPGMALAALCFYFVARHIKKGGWPWLVCAASAGALAVLFKNNYLICVIAAALVLALHCAATKKLAALAGGLAIVLAAAFSTLPIYAFYRARSSHDIPAGMPKILWVAMGLQESPKAPGWFNDYSYDTFEEVGEDPGLATEVAQADIRASLIRFAADPAYALWFFGTKNLAQWNEPTYAAIQQSHVLDTHTHALTPLALSLVEGTGEKLFYEYFNLYHFAVLALALAYFLLGRRGIPTPQLLFLLAILGGFAFHTLWEGKAQYIWQYFLLCLPYAAAGLDALLDRLDKLPLPALDRKKTA